MNALLKSILLAAVLGGATSGTAQVVLQNFSAFQSPNTFFVGNWEATGDPAGSNSPRASFSQGLGFYNFTGGTNSADASALYFFNAPLNITGLSLLELSARTLPGNVAANFSLILFDSIGDDAFALFSTAAFTGAGFTTVQVALTASPGFDFTDLSSFQLTGNAPAGSSLLNLAFDNLAVVAPTPVTAVPEPAAFGALGAFGLFGVIAMVRGRRRLRV